MKDNITKTDREITTWVSILYSVVFIILLFAYQNLPISFEILGFNTYINGDNRSDYLAVLSIHFTTVFLTTGLMSTLGAKEDLIYHVDIVQLILLKPVGRSFKALSVYSFLTLFWATVSFVCRMSYLVIFATVAGIVLVSYLFFKMIKIYFERGEMKERIKTALKTENSIEQLHKELVRLHLIIRSNIDEKQIPQLVENMALLIELRQYYLQEDDPEDWQSDLFIIAEGGKVPERRSSCVLDFLRASEDEIKDTQEISIFEIYVKIHERFLTELDNMPDKRKFISKKRSKRYQSKKVVLESCVESVEETLVTYWNEVRTNLPQNRCDIVKRIYKIDDILERLLKNYASQVADLKSIHDYQYVDLFLGVSKYVDLATKIFKTRMAITPGKVSYDVMSGAEVYYDDIQVLINIDEQRIRNNEVVCSKAIYISNENSKYSRLLLSEENEEGSFARIFAGLARKYAGSNINKMLSCFYDAYNEISCVSDADRSWQYYSKFAGYSEDELEDKWCELHYGCPPCLYPRDEKTYETMMCLFFQGCAELIMSGCGKDFVNTVAQLVFHFWNTAQFYKEAESLPQFYIDTFYCIGRRLLYINDEPKDRYNEHTEDVQSFISRLITLCKEDDRPAPERVYLFDPEIVFADFLNNLEEFSPKYYEIEVVNTFKEIIGNATK